MPLSEGDPPGNGGVIQVIQSPNDKKKYRYMVLENGLRVLLISDPEMQNTSAAEDDGQGPMEVEGGRGAAVGGKPATAASGAGAKQPRQDGKGRGAAAAAAAGSDEESSGDLMSGDGEGDEGEDEESSGSRSGSGEGDEDEDEDEEMTSREGGSGSGGGEEEEEEEEEEGSRRRGKKGGHKAPVKKAAAAMAVGVGSFSDPEDLQEVTNYHFEVAPAHLAGALDRFAQFFIAPLCNEGSMEREVLAVDSEFCQVLQDDHCLLAQIMCHTSRPGHIYRKFSWGNKASLWEQPRLAGLDVRRRLLEYYNRQYGADRSCLVVLGGEELDELARMVVDGFGAMPSGRGPQPSFAALEPPFEGRFLHVLPAVRDGHELKLTFQLPPMQRLYGSKADSYISHLLGHEGPGSLLSALKVGPQEWVWQEMRAVSEQRWRFLEEADPMDTVSRLAGAMHIARPEHTLVSEYLHERWQPDLVAKLLEKMEPAAPGVSYRIDLLTRRYDEVKSRVLALSSREGVEAREEREPWFNLEVVVMQLSVGVTEAAIRCDDPGTVVSEPSVCRFRSPPELLPAGVTTLLATPPVLLLDRPGHSAVRGAAAVQLPRGGVCARQCHVRGCRTAGGGSGFGAGSGILYEPCYDTLRTKQQLGYSVYSGTRLTGGVSGFCVQVVSARHPPEHLDVCVELFLASMAPRIRDMGARELGTHVGALAAAKLQRDRNQLDEASRLWGHITSQRYGHIRAHTLSIYIRYSLAQALCGVIPTPHHCSAAVYLALRCGGRVWRAGVEGGCGGRVWRAGVEGGCGGRVMTVVRAGEAVCKGGEKAAKGWLAG
ncbi:hypothetical protein VOLCADRAFT_94734 [Volvox carteri f. nagariensis]|uniref:Peptidase M16 C-terminal domain-containing protein n=1 Tax=Volvox carteri f. nagariensis TaxID=3068 RepID=D8U5L4_VOLCA|nr:uncharacterized protein VOLCADRAFT_94734 [Volvox carteri f. nagariensis]EFJ45023.1 hypothetical protein VOLCADRAFT_94734 [Volvox carteri f. nagariensis]|eukprot:XP_002953994.1 hypothetical protein VOLCADRAFT_94734 [Volvox carteri f. nagariensis]